jgi:hypothetical protein
LGARSVLGDPASLAENAALAGREAGEVACGNRFNFRIPSVFEHSLNEAEVWVAAFLVEVLGQICWLAATQKDLRDGLRETAFVAKGISGGVEGAIERVDVGGIELGFHYDITLGVGNGALELGKSELVSKALEVALGEEVGADLGTVMELEPEDPAGAGGDKGDVAGSSDWWGGDVSAGLVNEIVKIIAGSRPDIVGAAVV